MMLLNIALDASIGSIPIVGDLFFKANKCNLDLFQNHFEEGKNEGSARPVIIPILLILILIIILIVWLIFKSFGLLYEWVIS